jgi:tetratricopeptide (TPR) repeat protein
MTGKITLALTRKEANTYRSQGLPEEARDLYKKLLSSSPHFPPEIRADIGKQIRQIELEIGCEALEECQAISDEQIAVIKQGWRDQPSFDEIFTCAMTFYQIKRYGDALGELKKLSRNVDELKRAMGAIAACLIRLHGSGDLPAAVDKLASELFQNSKATLSFQAAIAAKALKWGYREHARSVLRHIGHYKDLPPEIQKRFFALARQFGSAAPPLDKWDGARRAAQPGRIGASGRPAMGMLWETAKSLNRRLLSKSRTTPLPHPCDIQESPKRSGFSAGRMRQ